MSPPEYLAFDILVDRSDGEYRARVLDSPAGQARGTFQSPATGEELATFLKDGRSRNDARAFGDRLFSALFAGDLLVSYRRSLDLARVAGKGLRLRLRLGDAPELARLPWEYLHDPVQDRFLALSSRTPLVRFIDHPVPSRPLEVMAPLNLLALLSGPADLEALAIDKEWQVLEDALGGIETLRAERVPRPTLPGLFGALRDGRYHIFHFTGHGSERNGGTGTIVMEDDDGFSRAVEGAQLGDLLMEHETVRLVVLNSCDGARGAPDNPFTGVAQVLVRQGIPAVIAMQTVISDEAAVLFSRELYRALAAGSPIDAALAEARLALSLLEESIEWGTPVLFMRAKDGALFHFPKGKDNQGAPLHPPGGSVLAPDSKPPPATPPPQRNHVPPAPGADLFTLELDEIAGKLIQRRLVLLVGADLPASQTGVPSQQELADGLAARHGLAPGQRLASVAQQVMRDGKRFEFTSYLKEQLEGVTPSTGPFYERLAEVVVRSNPQLVVTTALHQRLERAIEARIRRQVNSISTDSALPFASPDAPIILHLFGDTRQVESLVVTEQDRNALLGGRFADKQDIVDEVRRAFRSNSVLLTGCDPGDPAITALFDEVAGDRFRMPAWAIWDGLSEKEVEAIESNRGLRLLLIDPLEVFARLLRRLT